MPTLAPSSRIQVLSRPIAHPGKCAQCGAADKAVIDTGATIKWYGAVYFCIECVTEMAVAIDMVPASMLKDSEQAEATVVKKYLDAKGLVAINGDKYDASLDLLSNCLINLSSSSDVSIDTADTNVQPQNELTTPSLSELINDPADSILDALIDYPERHEQSDDTIVSEGPNVLPDDRNEYRLTLE